jgi:hypothetical protein
MEIAMTDFKPMNACLLPLALLAAPAWADPILPDFAAADFSTPAENPYFPLVTGMTRVMQGSGTEDGKPVTEMAVLTIVGPGPVIMGVQSIVASDEVFHGAQLIERAVDYFAADAQGNIWYLGEDVENFRYDEAGVLTGTDNLSAWKAGVNGAVPGIGLPADLTPHVELFQEHAPADEAMDYASVVETGLTLDTPAGHFTDVVKFYEASMAEADLREYKYYAPGVGMIRTDEGLDEGLANPDLVTELLH